MPNHALNSNFLDSRITRDQKDLARQCNEQNYATTAHIQPFAVLFITDQQLYIEKISSNAHGFGATPNELLGENILSLIAEQDHALLSEAAADLMRDPNAERRYLSWSWHPKFCLESSVTQGFIFRSRDFLCFEALLPEAPIADKLHYIKKNHASSEIARFSGDLPSFADLLTKHIRSITGFDRLYCFQFDEDSNGKVVGESLNDVYPSLALHHFPASDIPTNLREVYRRNRFRHLPNTSYQPIPLLELTGNSAPLDLGMSLSRQIGATHLQYLNNMGVAASLSFSIIIGGKLWGLLGGHHSKARQLPLQTLLDVQELVELFASKLTAIIEVTANASLGERTNHILTLTRIFESNDCNLEAFTSEDLNILKQLLQADSLIWVKNDAMGGDGLTTLGIMPIIDFAQAQTRQRPIFVTNSLTKHDERFAGLAAQASGMLALALDADDLLIWLRAEQLQQKKWGGNPHQAIQVDADGTIGPRQSFATWVEQVRYSAIPWETADLNTAQHICSAFAGVKLNHISRLQTQNQSLQNEISERRAVEATLRETNRQLESFAYIASHDLQEPLRMVASYCQLLERRYAEKLDGTARQYLGYATDGAKRMRILINSILEYSRLDSKAQAHETVGLDDVCTDVIQALAEAIQASNATLTIGKLPEVFGEKTQLYQLLQNLISNALKFHAVDQAVKISISAQQENDHCRIAITDNGIGIPADMQQKVFEMFQRLNPRDYAGTGIGLALCRRIVDLHGGRIWFESNPSQGTTFFFTLPNPQASAT